MIVTLVIGRRHVYRDYLRAHDGDTRQIRHVISAESMRGYHDAEIVFLPYWWEAYPAETARAIEDEARVIEALR